MTSNSRQNRSSNGFSRAQETSPVRTMIKPNVQPEDNWDLVANPSNYLDNLP